MWNCQLAGFLLLIEYLARFTVYSQEILLLHDNTNSTIDGYSVLRKDALPTWTNQQLIVCFISVSLGTLLFFITFVVPAMIIVRRARRDKYRFDLRELRRMSDFV
ncbi:unnamed protein product [Adineta ricciae]|uniref:Uncharacterized protein n=1 Tax=Adineta ricciae TaxID=249248 RepID=A0A814NCD0_ADIRI|nr:unnamed protein product [Adineta ricciae]CAF1160766.1 unnamed protein product [Adineta ricciae]